MIRMGFVRVLIMGVRPRRIATGAERQREADQQ
jgi:hypothetical protein